MSNMRISKILKCICVFLLSSSPLWSAAQRPIPNDSTKQNFKGVQYANKDSERAQRLLGNRRVPLFAGASLSADLMGATLLHITSYGQYEAAFRLNLRNTYFPIAELGWGVANMQGETTQLRFKTQAPYLRLGMDYNVKGDKRSRNRVFVGTRYGVSVFTYDLAGPDQIDSHWQTFTPFVHQGISSSAHWGEFLFGLQTQLWKFIHLGWSLRYRFRIYEDIAPTGRAAYIPGFGSNRDATLWGGTFNLVLDLSQL